MRASRRAFTLIELLVVVAIIAVLIAILLPSLSRARESTKKTVCAANLKAQGTGMSVYAASFGDSLPIFYNNGCVWPCDEDNQFANPLLDINQQQASTMAGSDRADSLRRMFYCPSNQTYSESNNHWNVAGSYRAHGYAYFNSRWAPGMERTNLDQAVLPTPRTQPPMKYLFKLSANLFPSQVELANDLIFTVQPGTPMTPNLSNVNWIFPNDTTTELNHRVGRNAPAGANSLCCDGHVEWRNFSPSKVHYIGGVSFGPTQMYWFYPDP